MSLGGRQGVTLEDARTKLKGWITTPLTVFKESVAIFLKTIWHTIWSASNKFAKAGEVFNSLFNGSPIAGS